MPAKKAKPTKKVAKPAKKVTKKVTKKAPAKKPTKKVVKKAKKTVQVEQTVPVVAVQPVVTNGVVTMNPVQSDVAN
jgi:hypothetical protein